MIDDLRLCSFPYCPSTCTRRPVDSTSIKTKRNDEHFFYLFDFCLHRFCMVCQTDNEVSDRQTGVLFSDVRVSRSSGSRTTHFEDCRSTIDHPHESLFET